MRRFCQQSISASAVTVYPINLKMSSLQGLLEQARGHLSSISPVSSPLTLPLAPTAPISNLIAHLTSTPLHPTYFPYLRFGILHAIRVTTVWAGLTKARQERIGVLHDLFGYLTMACKSVPYQPWFWLTDRGRRHYCFASSQSTAIMACPLDTLANLPHRLSPPSSDRHLAIHRRHMPYPALQHRNGLYRRDHQGHNYRSGTCYASEQHKLRWAWQLAGGYSPQRDCSLWRRMARFRIRTA